MVTGSRDDTFGQDDGLRHAAKRIVATPFPKFFNAGERGEPIPDLSPLRPGATYLAEALYPAMGESLKDLSDKDVGLRLGTMDAELRPFIFAWRKQGGDLLKGRSRDAVRPTGNVLPGYVVSYALGRVFDETG